MLDPAFPPKVLARTVEDGYFQGRGCFSEVCWNPERSGLVRGSSFLHSRSWAGIFLGRDDSAHWKAARRSGSAVGSLPLLYPAALVRWNRLGAPHGGVAL